MDNSSANLEFLSNDYNVAKGLLSILNLEYINENEWLSDDGVVRPNLTDYLISLRSW